MIQQLDDIRQKTKSLSSSYQVRFFRLSRQEDREQLHTLLNENPHIQVFDELMGQIGELVKSLSPKTRFSREALAKAAEDHLKGSDPDEYGVWIYYPWSFRLVHALDEKEFVEVRTNRNQYKITPQERDLLETKKIGIIGLSVGQSIALTIAMERIAGEIRLADFDKLELSNFNRIRTGIHNLEVSKVVAVAREIAEMDPYLKVTCFEEGLNEHNIDDFFLRGGKLDACIEVCDGLEMKIVSRIKARELRVPVIMTSSDRGTTDVERYDLDPGQPLLHGLIDHLDLSRVKEAKTNEEKVPYLLPMLGLDTTSTRLRASMLEIEQSITTWPQLASGVVVGGSICASICRRIFLDEFHDSGRYFVDIDDIIKDKDEKEYAETPLNINPSLTDSEMLDLIRTCDAPQMKGQADIGAETIREIVEAACLAPSGANSQTWKWMYHDRSLYMFFDDVLRPDLLDCKRTTMITGLGAAAENLVLKAHELNLEVVSRVFGIDDSTRLIAIFRFFTDKPEEPVDGLEPHVCDELSGTIPYRISNRNICEKVIKIEKERLSRLREAAQTIPGADLLIIDDRERLDELAEITARMDRIRYLSKGGHNDFRGEARWTIEDALKTRNGISFRETMDLTPTEFAGFYVSKNWPVVKHLADWKLGSAFGKIQRKWVKSASAMGLLTMPRFGTDDFFLGGRALERVWLAANKDNISTHPPSLSTLIFNTVLYGPEDALPPEMRTEALELLKKFNAIFSVNSGDGKILLLRFFIGDPPKYKSLRYPVEQVLRFSTQIL